MNEAIAIRNLSKFYRQFQALYDVTFSIHEGDFFGFLGPNGAGKTTTIHAITGLANFQQGDIRVFGHDVVRDYRKARSLIGLVPQEFNFDPYLNAEQILVYEAGYFGVPRSEAKTRAAGLLDEFGLTEHRALDYRKLSGGMKRRLLIARALMHRPKILILDEPTAGVDLELRLRLWDYLRDLNRIKRITILLTTHYIEEAERLCSQIGVIHEGRIVALDKKEALLATLGHEILEIEMDRRFDSVPPIFQPFGVELMNGGSILRFKKNEKQLPQLLQALHQQGIQIVGINTRKTSLEEIFLEMTRK